MNTKRKKRDRGDILAIGEIAKEIGVLPSRVRFYTNLGLLKETSRTQGGYRLYKKQQTIVRFKKILQLKKEGLSLEKIKKIIDKKDKLEKINTFPDIISPDSIKILERYPVKFAYLFGSCAKGEARGLSDIDIAVFLDEKLDDNERFNLRLELIGQMAAIFKTDKIDVVILNDSPLFLCFNIIYAGRIIYSGDERRRIEFEAKVMSLYFDQQYYYKRHALATINRVAMEGIL